MKTFFILIFSLLFCSLQAQQETYQRVQIDLNETSLHEIASLGIPLDAGTLKPGYFVELELSASELESLRDAEINYTVLIEDLVSFYSERNVADTHTRIVRNPADEFPVPENWEYGSMGGFYTYQEVLDKLDFMAAQWPDLITVKAPVNEDLLTHDGNPIWWVKISDNPNESEDEPDVLYTALHHAREGIGVQQMMYFMLHLLENYETDERIQAIVNNRELYFVPILNPDGYLYNEQTNPNGNGMWRKNRRNNGGSWGVDINRNYGFMWGLDDNGSSPNPSSETYRGPEAFSEPEIQNIKQFVEEHEFMIALNYHSYSNLLLYPWGYTNAPCPDDAIFYAHATLMTRDNRYVYGPGSSTIYPTNGGSDDWMYGETENKNQVFAYTPEVGGSGDGFWPSTNRIIPLCQENMIQNYYAAFFSGDYGTITETSGPVISEKSFYLTFDLQRLGFSDTENWTVSVVPISENIFETEEPVSIGYLEILETVSDSIAITLDPDIMSGDTLRFLIQLDNGEFVTTDTLVKYYGTTSVIFEDDCEDFDNWTSSKWDNTTSDFHSPVASITDSPSGNYSNNENNIITLNNPIEIPNTSMVLLRYWAKWEIEYDWDYVQLQLRENGIGSWVALEGNHTRAGSNNQATGEPLYDGNQSWVHETVDLSAYAGKSIELRFVLRSDSYETEDGFYFDDMEVIILDIETGIDAVNSNLQKFSFYPNPATDRITLSTNRITNETCSIQLMDLSGRTVQHWQMPAGQRQFQLSLASLPSGTYLLQIETAGFVQREKITLY
ncbi:MAG TPA: M14 family zinc carboxypeptidase [Bacteroidales bacterium]|nr:M14 family zinc carboxypeptidase [Bacteroidales bacterium]